MHCTPGTPSTERYGTVMKVLSIPSDERQGTVMEVLNVSNFTIRGDKREYTAH